MLVEAIAAGVVGAALLWLVLQPLLLPSLAGDEPLDIPDPEETPRGQALIALREIDFDKATGKLSDADYTDLHARYSAIAIAAMSTDPAPSVNDPLELMIASRARATSSATATAGAPSCLVHGPRPEGEAKFCSICGAGLVTDAGHCAACNAIIPEGGVFCPGCGVRVS